MLPYLSPPVAFISDGATPLFQRCTFHGNVDVLEDWGGGAAWIQSDAVFEDCTFTENAAAGGGGAIWMGRLAEPVFRRCAFVRNLVSSPVYGGGAVRLKQGCKPTYEDCTFVDNDGGVEGGAIYATGDARPVFTGGLVQGNAAIEFGGGVYAEQGAYVTFTDVVVADNTAANGAGIMLTGDNKPRFTNVTLANNHALRLGGGVRVTVRSDPTFVDCDFVGNTAAQGGGGIHTEGLELGAVPNSIVTLHNVTFVRNGRDDADGGAILAVRGYSRAGSCCMLWGSHPALALLRVCCPMRTALQCMPRTARSMATVAASVAPSRQQQRRRL